MSAIENNIDQIRRATYGRDVREAIAASIEECYSDVSTSSTLANEAATTATTSAETADQAAQRANDAAAIAEPYAEELVSLKNTFENTATMIGSPDVIKTVVHPASGSAYKRNICTYTSNDNITGNYIYVPFSSSATAPASSLGNISAWSKDIVLEDGHRYELSVSGSGTYETAGTGEANVSVYVSAGNVSADYGLVAGYNLIGEPYSSTLKKHLNKTFVYDSAMGNIMIFLCLGHFKGSNYSISAILKDTTEGNRIITIGTAKDYTSFTDAIKALSNDTSHKTIYVDPGVYDVFAEYGGASYMSSLNTAGLSWTDVCAIVPPNTHIIGLGDVILRWNPTDSQIIDQAHAFLFAPLNLQGSCEIENIRIECSNCRYGIHDETGGLAQFDGAVHKFKNVSVVYTGSTYGTKYAYGAGHNKNMKLIFEDCLFSAANGSVWSTHDWTAGQYEGSQITFDNCIFVNTAQNMDGSVRFSSSDTVGRTDRVRFNNCRLRNISFSTEASREANQCYDVTLIGCNQVGTVYSDFISISSRVDPTQINVIGQVT